MSDATLETTAAQHKWDKRTVARLTDAAYALMQLRTLRDHVHRIVRRDEGRAAFQLQSEVEAYGDPLMHRSEAILIEYGADPGQSGDDAMKLWQGLSRVFYRVPDAPTEKP